MVDVRFFSLTGESLLKTNGFKASRRVATNGFKAIFPGETETNPSVKEPMVDEQTVCLIGRQMPEMVRNC